MCTINSPVRPTTATDTGQPLALQSAIAVVAMTTAASTERSLRASVCAEAGRRECAGQSTGQTCANAIRVAAVMNHPPLGRSVRRHAGG